MWNSIRKIINKMLGKVNTPRIEKFSVDVKTLTDDFSEIYTTIMNEMSILGVKNSDLPNPQQIVRDIELIERGRIDLVEMVETKELPKPSLLASSLRRFQSFGSNISGLVTPRATINQI